MLMQRLIVSLSVILVTIKQVLSASNNCSHLRTTPLPIDGQNKYSLWPELMSAYDLENGEILPGFYEVISIMYGIFYAMGHVLCICCAACAGHGDNLEESKSA
jgi:hypothetical protein